MPLIPATTTPTAQDQLQSLVGEYLNAIIGQFASNQNLVRKFANFVYACPLDNGSGAKFTPQDVFTAIQTKGADYGLTAAGLCQICAATLTWLGTLQAAPVIPPAGITLTAATDNSGAITVAGTTAQQSLDAARAALASAQAAVATDQTALTAAQAAMY